MNRTLIVISSRWEASGICANRIFELIEGHVDLCFLEERKDVVNLSNYQTIIVGSDMHEDLPEQEITSFCETYAGLLLSKRLGLFVTTSDSEVQAQEKLQQVYPKELSEHAIILKSFEHERVQRKTGFWERLLLGNKKNVAEYNIVMTCGQHKIDDFVKTINTPDEA